MRPLSSSSVNKWVLIQIGNVQNRFSWIPADRIWKNSYTHTSAKLSIFVLPSEYRIQQANLAHLAYLTFSFLQFSVILPNKMENRRILVIAGSDSSGGASVLYHFCLRDPIDILAAVLKQTSGLLPRTNAMR